MTKMMNGIKYIFFVLIGLILSAQANAQMLLKSEDFPLSAMFLEPDDRHRMLRISDQEFITYAKTDGKMVSESEYVIRKMNVKLQVLWEAKLKISETEDIHDIYFNAEKVFILVIDHNESAKKSILKSYSFTMANGKPANPQVLYTLNVGKWDASRGKGVVIESFDNVIASNLKGGYLVPLQYQYHIKYSPNRDKLLAYIYDYSDVKLKVHTVFLDQNLNEIQKEILSVDNGFINYGVYPNDNNIAYILNEDRQGRIEVIQYNYLTKEHKILDIQHSNTNRDNLGLKVVNDHEVYVYNLMKKQELLVGVMYTKMSFETNLIENLHFQEISLGFRDGYNSSRDHHEDLNGKEDWKYWDIADIKIDDNDKVTFVLEKKWIQSPDYLYSSHSINDLNKWVEREAKVKTEGVIIMSFSSTNDLLWMNYHIKHQEIDIADGLNTASIKFSDQHDGIYRILYGSSESSLGIMNTIHMVEFDEATGVVNRDITLPNDSKLVPLRSYVFFFGKDNLILVGKKGLLGKKTEINLYKLL